jgi:hypothetical protein
MIAEKARAKSVGARGLRGIVEEIMLDVMFEFLIKLPGRSTRSMWTLPMAKSDTLRAFRNAKKPLKFARLLDCVFIGRVLLPVCFGPD